MKYRNDFVTNSSSSSYIICFARIADLEKASKIIEKNGLKICTKRDIEHEMIYDGALGNDWSGVELWGIDKILNKYPNSKYIIIEGGFEIYEPWDREPDYDVEYEEFEESDIIDQITKDNGFADVQCDYGAGKNG